MTSTFKHFNLSLIKPDFDSYLTNLIIDLDKLRDKLIYGSTAPFMFFQLKEIYHLLESLGSARIEGNNTTIAEVIEHKIDNSNANKPNIAEIDNIRAAMKFIDENIETQPINKIFIREIHKIVVSGLPIPPNGEGDKTPGEFRDCPVQIVKAKHNPPELKDQVISYIEDLIQFIQTEDKTQYDLIKTAIAHHRFMWIHPFRNGNGRTGRLITYAMLLKQGFNLKKGRLINPTAVFCLDRNLYNNKLATADSGTEKALTEWCEFVLDGLKNEIQKIDKLLDYQYLKNEIISPALKLSLDRKLITPIEYSILNWTINNKKQTVVAGDIKKNILKDKSSQQISNLIKKLVLNKMLMPFPDSPRKYYLRFDNNYLLRGIVQILGEKGFLPF